MRVLVIGGTRFIGRHLVPRLLTEGHQVVLFNRGRHPNPFEGRVETIVGDRQIAGELKTKLRGESFDAVIDMVAYNAAELADAVEAFSDSANHFIFISTRSVYKTPVTAPIREGDRLEDDASNSYGFNKVQAELVALKAYEETGFPCTILRLPAVYGPYDYQGREWYFIRRLMDGRKAMLLPDFGWGVNQREYAGNIAEQITFLLTKPQSIGQVYNSGHRHFQNYRDLVTLAAGIFGTKLTLYGVQNEDMPWNVVLAEAGLRTVATGKLEALGYKEPYDLYAGLKATIDYFVKHPIGDDWKFAALQKKDLFDYQLEDEIIEQRGVCLE